MFKKAIAVFVAVIIVACVSVVPFSAKSKTFYSDKTKITVSKSTSVTITSTKGGSLSFKIKNPKICSAKWGKWSGSKIKLTVTGKKNGKTSIAVTNKKTKEKLTLNVTVKSVKVKKITLSKKTLSLKKGAAATLKCTVNPSNATNSNVKWTSSNTKVATVSSKGKITAKKSGIAIITAAAADGSKLKTKCTVTVLNKTVKQTVSNNLEYLKTYIQDAGDYNKYGEQGIFGTYKDDEFDASYSIRYLPDKKMFEFGWSSDYSDDPDEYHIESSFSFYYSLTGFDIVSADYTEGYYEYGSITDSYSAEVIINSADYNAESVTPSIKITSNTSDLSNDKIKQYINSDFKTGMNALNSLLGNELGMSLSDIGFENF